MALTGCGADDANGPSARLGQSPSDQVSLTPQQVFLRTVEITGEQPSYRAEVEELQRFPQEGTFFVTRTVSRGVYQAPDQIEVSTEITFEAPTGTTSYQAELISTGGTSYHKDPESGEWTAHTGPNITPLEETGLTPSGEGLEALQTLESWPLQFGPDDTLDGEAVFHLRRTLLNGESRGRSRLEYWIGRGDFLVKQAMLSYEGPERHEFTRTFRFSDFGVTVTIQPPDVSVQRDVTVDAVREEDVVIIDPVLRVVRGERKDGNCVLTVESERMPGEPPKLVRQNIGGQ